MPNTYKDTHGHFVGKEDDGKKCTHEDGSSSLKEGQKVTVAKGKPSEMKGKIVGKGEPINTPLGTKERYIIEYDTPFGKKQELYKVDDITASDDFDSDDDFNIDDDETPVASDNTEEDGTSQLSEDDIDAARSGFFYYLENLDTSDEYWEEMPTIDDMVYNVSEYLKEGWIDEEEFNKKPEAFKNYVRSLVEENKDEIFPVIQKALDSYYDDDNDYEYSGYDDGNYDDNSLSDDEKELANYYLSKYYHDVDDKKSANEILQLMAQDEGQAKDLAIENHDLLAEYLNNEIFSSENFASKRKNKDYDRDKTLQMLGAK